MGKIKKILENELVGGTQNTDVYPVTSTKAVYNEDNESLDSILKRRGIINVSTNYNSTHTAETLTLEQAIAKVPSKDRVLGFTMTFLSSDGWKNYQFTGTTINNWTDINNWISFVNDAQLKSNQDSIIEKLNTKVNNSDIVQQTGDSTTSVMSQKAVTDALGSFSTQNNITEYKNEKSMGWHTENCNLVSGTEYTCKYYSLDNAKYNFALKLYSSDGSVITGTYIFNNNSKDAGGVFKFTPDVDAVKISYYNSANGYIEIFRPNENKYILNIDDIANDFNGGEKRVLSAEQGKILKDKVDKDAEILNMRRYTASLGKIVNGKIFSSTTVAYLILKNEGIETIRVEAGYKFDNIFSSDKAIGGTTVNLVVNSCVDFNNTTEAPYLLLNISKVNGGNFNGGENENIVTIIGKQQNYTLHNILNSELFKFGIYEEIEEERSAEVGKIDKNGNIATNYDTPISEYIDVSGLVAIKTYSYLTKMYDNNQNSASPLIVWYDGNKNFLGSSQSVATYDKADFIFYVPQGAKYARWNIPLAEKTMGVSLKSIEDTIYRNGRPSPLRKLKKATFIITNGQSLSIGSGANNPFDIIPKYHQNLMLKRVNSFDETQPIYNRFTGLKNNPPVSENDTTNGTNPQVGMGEAFVEMLEKECNVDVLANEWEEHYLIYSSCGTGGLTIDQLLAQDQYAYVDNTIKLCKYLCDRNGWEIDMPAWVWMQGEQDIKGRMSSSEYKTKLLQMHDKVCSSIKAITGQEYRPKCIIYQPSCQNIYTLDYGFSNPYLGVPTAFTELLRENDEFIASTPVYIFEPCKIETLGAWVHLDEISYHILGAYNGYTLKKWCIDGIANKGLIPLNISLSGNSITITYNVPCPPLCIDESIVKKVPNFGFNVVKSDNTELITNVEVLRDRVKINCSENPVGAKLRYGLNGDKVSLQGNPYVSGAGAYHGARGNLRDSQGMFVYADAEGRKYPMYNWAYCFEKQL